MWLCLSERREIREFHIQEGEGRFVNVMNIEAFLEHFHNIFFIYFFYFWCHSFSSLYIILLRCSVSTVNIGQSWALPMPTGSPIRHTPLNDNFRVVTPTDPHHRLSWWWWWLWVLNKQMSLAVEFFLFIFIINRSLTATSKLGGKKVHKCVDKNYLK